MHWSSLLTFRHSRKDGGKLSETTGDLTPYPTPTPPKKDRPNLFCFCRPLTVFFLKGWGEGEHVRKESVELLMVTRDDKHQNILNKPEYIKKTTELQIFTYHLGWLLG